MARLSRAEIFDPSEIAAVHVMARTNRRCFLMGDDQLTGWDDTEIALRWWSLCPQRKFVLND